MSNTESPPGAPIAAETKTMNEEMADKKSLTEETIAEAEETNTEAEVEEVVEVEEVDEKKEKEKDDEERALAKRQERMKQRELIVKEMMKTERLYVQGLELLDELYLNPLAEMCREQKEKGEEPWFPDEDYDECFHSLPLIQSINRMLLDRFEDIEQERAQEGWETLPMVLKMMGPRLKSYTNYVSMYDDIANKVKSVMKRNAELDMWIKETESREKRNGYQGFFSYMITPVQRIPRYQLLLRELEKNTDPDHPEWNDIQEANKEIKSVAMHINERRRDQEIYRVLANISDSYDMSAMSDGFLVKGRSLIMECDMLESNHGKLKPSARKVFLFTDLLLFVSVKKSQYSSHFKLNTAPIPWIDGLEATASTDFDVVTSTGNISLRAQSVEEREKFCQKLQDVIDHLVETVPKMKDQPKADKAENRRLKKRRQRQPLHDAEENQADEGPKYEPTVITTMDFESTKISFRAGEILFVKHKFPDGSILASNGSSVPGAVQPQMSIRRNAQFLLRTGKVTSEYYRELYDEEKLVSPYVSTSEKREAAERVAESIEDYEPTEYGLEKEEWTIAECPFYGEEPEEPEPEEIEEVTVNETSPSSTISPSTGSSYTDEEMTQTRNVESSTEQEQQQPALVKKQSTKNLFKALQLKLLRKPGTPRSTKRKSLPNEKSLSSVRRSSPVPFSDKTEEQLEVERKKLEAEEEEQRRQLHEQKARLQSQLLAFSKKRAKLKKAEKIKSQKAEKSDKSSRSSTSQGSSQQDSLQVPSNPESEVPDLKVEPRSVEVRKSLSRPLPPRFTARKATQGREPGRDASRKSARLRKSLDQLQEEELRKEQYQKEEQELQKEQESEKSETSQVEESPSANDASSESTASELDTLIVPSSENVRSRFSLRSARLSKKMEKVEKVEEEEENLAPWIRELRNRANRNAKQGSIPLSKVVNRLSMRQEK